MSEEQAAETGKWIFDCQKCSFTSQEDSEPEALDAASNHADYGPGHWDFEIRDPDGVKRYP